MSGLGWVDWALLAVLGASMLIGLVRGFVFEVMSLAGWLVAWFAAQWATPQAAAYVPVGAPGSTANFAVTFVLCFLATLIVWTLMSRLVRLLIHATPLSIPDRLLGAGFGLIRGGVLLLAVATVVALTPAGKSPPWQQSQGARWLEITRQGLLPLLPADVARRFPA